jgi:hypothetical protein
LPEDLPEDPADASTQVSGGRLSLLANQPQLCAGAAEAGVQLASLEDPITLVQSGWDDRLRHLDGDRQPDVDRLHDPSGHRRGGVLIAGADAAATLQFPSAAALVAHQFIDHPGRDAFVLQPGRKAVPKIVGSVKLQVRKIALGAMGCVLVEPAETVARQDRPCASRHAVPATGAGKHESIRVGIERQLTANRLDH